MDGREREKNRDRIVQLPRGNERARQAEGESHERYEQRLENDVEAARARLEDTRRSLAMWKKQLAQHNDEIEKRRGNFKDGIVDIAAHQEALWHEDRTLRANRMIEEYEHDVMEAEAEYQRAAQRKIAFDRQQELRRQKEKDGPTGE